MRIQPMQFFNTFVRIAFAAILILAALPGLATAQQNNTLASPTSPATASSVPQIIQFSGQFSGTSGGAAVPSGTVSITFTLYENEQGGTALWSETDNVQVNAQGQYTALLGSASPEGLPMNLFTTVQAHWLAVQPLLEGFGDQPRVLLVSAPYALKAGDAETIGGFPPSAFVRTDASLGASTTMPVTTTAGAGTTSAPTTAGTGTTAVTTTASKGPAQANRKRPSTFECGDYCDAGTGYTIEGNVVVGTPGGNGRNVALGAYGLYSDTTGSYNMASGYAALINNTTGSYNTASGYEALEYTTTGINNTATGYAALGVNSSGGGNTAFGVNALENNTVSNNSAFGTDALEGNSTGGYNTAAGYQALYKNTIGNSNAAAGYQALYNNNGSHNTAFGSGALADNTSGSGNIAIGRNAGLSVSGGKSNNIEIGNGGSSSDSGAIRIGTVGTQTSSYIAGIYGVALPSSGQPLVCVDSSGQLGTANCANTGQIEALQKQNEDLQQRVARLEALIEKK
jgi:hypothetical protein